MNWNQYNIDIIIWKELSSQFCILQPEVDLSIRVTRCVFHELHDLCIYF